MAPKTSVTTAGVAWKIVNGLEQKNRGVHFQTKSRENTRVDGIFNTAPNNNRWSVVARGLGKICW